MSIESDLYILRQQLGKQKQPNTGTELEQLDGLLKGNGYNNPYEPRDYGFLEIVSPYKIGGQGPPATYKSARMSRIHSIGGLARYGTTWIDANNNLDKKSVKELFRILCQEFIATGKWLPLKKYATGEYWGGKRRFTFWTDGEHEADESIVLSAYQCGMPIDWLSEHTVVLRWMSATVPDDIRLPSAIDAVLSPIFQPSDWTGTTYPHCGTAIDISDMTELKKGWNEFVVRPISVDNIFFAPVYVGEATIRKSGEVRLCEALFKKLLEYHKSSE